MRKVLILLTILCTWAAVVCAQGKYSIASGEAPKAGSKITSVPFITLTYGAEGGKDFIAAGEGFSEYTPGNGINPTPTSLPTTGTFYKFDVYKDGTLQVGVVLEANKKFFVLEDGVPMTDYNGILSLSRSIKPTMFTVPTAVWVSSVSYSTMAKTPHYLPTTSTNR